MALQREIRMGTSKMMRCSDTRGEIEMIDRGTTSVFDRGAIPDFESNDIAIARTTQTEALFHVLKYHGTRTHCVGRESDTSLRVRESRVNNLPLLSGFASAKMLGVEVLCRWQASKKFFERYQKGEIPASKLRLYTGDVLKPGTRFAAPFVEFSTKWRPGGDVYLSDIEAAEVTQSSEQDIREVLDLGKKVAEIIEHFVFKTGYFLEDFKIEVAKEYGLGGRFCVIDVITLDEMGMSKNTDQIYGKNPIRFYYQERHGKWVQELKAAQAEFPEDKKRWPEYPPLPDWLKREQVSKYQEVAANWSSFVAKHYS